MPHNRNHLSRSHTRLPVRAAADDSNRRPAQTAYVSRVGYTHDHLYTTVRHEPYPMVRTCSSQRSSAGSVYELDAVIEANNRPNGESLSSVTASYFHTFSGYYNDTLTIPATPLLQNTSNWSSTTLNTPTSTPPPTAFPEFSLELIGSEYSDYPILEIASTSIIPLSTSLTLLHPRPVPNSPYPNTRACASSRTTPSRSYGIELPETNLQSPYDQPLPSPSGSVLSESGYGVGSEGYISQGTIFCGVGEEGSHERDVNSNEETEPEDRPEILTWVEIRVDSSSEEEEVEAQE